MRHHGSAWRERHGVKHATPTAAMPWSTAAASRSVRGSPDGADAGFGAHTLRKREELEQRVVHRLRPFLLRPVAAPGEHHGTVQAGHRVLRAGESPIERPAT